MRLCFWVLDHVYWEEGAGTMVQTTSRVKSPKETRARLVLDSSGEPVSPHTKVDHH